MSVKIECLLCRRKALPESFKSGRVPYCRVHRDAKVNIRFYGLPIMISAPVGYLAVEKDLGKIPSGSQRGGAL